jgi:Ca-activated chloride channel homolog
MFEFARPQVLWLVLPLLAAWFLLRNRLDDPAAMRHAHLPLLAGVRAGWRVRLRRTLPWLNLLVMLLLILAMAGPRQAYDSRQVDGEGIDIVLALDISGSMQALDFQPANRLEVAKSIIRDFILERSGDRIGLVVFASRAFTQCPLTLDRDILSGFLDEVQIGLIEDGTAIGLGLATSVNRLRHSDAESRTVILLTDGSNNVPTLEPETAAELASALGVRVYTVGVGKKGQVPFPQQGIFGRTTRMVEMPIDEALLRRVAEQTGGTYFRAEDPEALQKIFDTIGELETSRFQVNVISWHEDKMHWFALPALLLLLLAELAGAGWLRRLP